MRSLRGVRVWVQHGVVLDVRVDVVVLLVVWGVLDDLVLEVVLEDVRHYDVAVNVLTLD
jgi:hypothetical protein